MTAIMERVRVTDRRHPYSGLVGMVIRRGLGQVYVELNDVRPDGSRAWLWIRPEQLEPWSNDGN